MTESELDPIEKEYIKAINNATTSDRAYELSVGLREYRKNFKDLIDEN